MLGSFIQHGLKEDELVAESLLQILAGSDTTATTIRATMLFLMSHPSAYRKLQEEIDTAVREGRASSPIIKSSEAQELPYLQAVIREGIRIWPAATGLFTKVVPPEGDTVTVDDKCVFLPGGTNIGTCVWGVLRRKDVFGEDAVTFRPERWLEASGDKLAYMHKTADLAFGWAKYQCLGKNIAWMELSKAFFEVSPKRLRLLLGNMANKYTSSSVALTSRSWTRRSLGRARIWACGYCRRSGCRLLIAWARKVMCL